MSESGRICKRCGCKSYHYRFCEDVTRLEAKLAAANKLRHDQILYSDKALTAARKAIAVMAYTGSWDDEIKEQIRLAEQDNLKLVQPKETINDHDN